jgi:two-component system chemotaxis response regulator CheB
MAKPRIVAIGASAGGVEALKYLAGRLPQGFPAPIVIVQHLAPESPGYLPEILARAGPLPAHNAADKQVLEAGHIYLAPADYHMLVKQGGYIRLGQGARENRVRPAIDPLFRSVAVAYGNGAIGVVLTGSLDDGTAGLAAIKGCGGIAVVQDPGDAAVPSMPQSALRHVVVDHVVPLGDIASLLTALVKAEPPTDMREVAAMTRELDMELKMAAGETADVDMARLGEPSLFTCPECHGALVELRDKAPLRYRCHTGHAFSAVSLAAALRESTEASLWSTVRAFQETAMLMRHIARHANTQEPAALVRDLERYAEEAERHARALQQIRLEQPETTRIEEAAGKRSGRS